MGQARDLAQRWFDAVKTGDPATIAGLLTDDCDFYTPGGPVSSSQEAARYVGAFTAAVPDAEFDVKAWVEEGEHVVAEGVYRGTHTGPLVGPDGAIPPTGRPIEIPFVTVFGAREGKIAAHRAYWDNATFMAQLGLMPGVEESGPKA